MIQENRSFDNLFATYPGADGTTTGRMQGKHGPRRIPLQEVDLTEPCDFGHSYSGFIKDYDGGRMDGFNTEGGGNGSACAGPAGKHPYQYVNPQQIAPYWDIANQYVLADEMFQTQGSGSFTAHQDLIRGGTMIDQKQKISLVDFPSTTPWGCDAPASTKTPELVWGHDELTHVGGGPAPCTTDFPSDGAYYPTLRDRLDAQSISWKYYSPPVENGVGKYWNAFDAIAPVRYGPEWGTNVTTTPNSQNEIFGDIQYGRLAAVSWLIPDEDNSDHPTTGHDTGPSWVASVVNAVGESQYWDSTAIIVVWDDWGGFYDHVPPPLPRDHWGGLGFRVPMLVVSAYARVGTGSLGGYISPTQYEFGSIVRFIEDNWNLGSLHTTDARANSIVDCFDFSQPPRAFTAIPSQYSKEYFLHQPPSNKPIDTE